MSSDCSKTLLLKIAACLSMVLAWMGSASAATAVVASIPELGEIAQEVGGAKVAVSVIARPNRDYHRIEPRPTDVQRIARARLVVRSGLSLDRWMDALMNAAGNRSLNRGGSGYVDASAQILRIEVPAGQISGASGDVHPDGNPHYYYDPIYAKFAARNILRGLIRVDGNNADHYRANYKRFNSEIDRRMASWQKELAAYQGRAVVTYHKTYAYFMRRFGLRSFATLEPKPGIPPSARHLSSVASRMKAEGVKALIVESIYPTRHAQLVSRQVGIRFVVAPYSAGSAGTRSYFDLIDVLVNRFREALSQ